MPVAALWHCCRHPSFSSSFPLAKAPAFYWFVRATQMSCWVFRNTRFSQHTGILNRQSFWPVSPCHVLEEASEHCGKLFGICWQLQRDEPHTTCSTLLLLGLVGQYCGFPCPQGCHLAVSPVSSLLRGRVAGCCGARAGRSWAPSPTPSDITPSASPSASP